VPDDVLDDQDALLRWAGRSREAALRAQAKKSRKKRASRGG